MQYTKFSLTRDVNGYNGFGLPFSINKYSVNLDQNTDTTLITPSYADNYIAIMSYQSGASVWVADNAVAMTPLGNTFSNTTSELNPVARYVKKGDILHFFCSDLSSFVGVVFYALPNS